MDYIHKLNLNLDKAEKNEIMSIFESRSHNQQRKPQNSQDIFADKIIECFQDDDFSHEIMKSVQSSRI